MRLGLAATLGTAVALVFAGAAATGNERASETLRIVGFASTLGDGTNTPRVEAPNGGTITKCRDQKALSAIFVIGSIASGSRYQQYWSSRGKTVFMGKTSTLSGGIADAETCVHGVHEEGSPEEREVHLPVHPRRPAARSRQRDPQVLTLRLLALRSFQLSSWSQAGRPLPTAQPRAPLRGRCRQA